MWAAIAESKSSARGETSAEQRGPAPCRRLSAWVEAVVAVGEAFESPSWFVGLVVVVAAEQDAVGEVGAATGVPGVEVVGLAPGAGDVAALGTTGPVADQQGPCAGSE